MAEAIQNIQALLGLSEPNSIGMSSAADDPALMSPHSMPNETSGNGGVHGGGGGGGGGNPMMEQYLETSIPGFGVLSKVLANWFKVDITTLAAIFFIAGALWTPLEAVQKYIYWTMVRFFTASISITPSDKLNRDVVNYIALEVIPRQGSRVLTARSELIPVDGSRWSRFGISEQNESRALPDETRVPIEYLPSFLTTFFVHDWRVFMVRRIADKFYTHDDRGPDEYLQAPTGEEPLIIMTLGWSIEPIKRLLDHCRDHADRHRTRYTSVRSSKPTIHRFDDGDPWEPAILRPIRPLETVHFDEAVKDDIVKDVTRYLDVKTRKFYQSRGIPYRRGYLLHGPPGTGKTSLSLALAGLFKLDLYLLHLPSITADGDTILARLFRSLPPKCIVLIEDIDAAGMRRDSSESQESLEDEKHRRYSRDQPTLSGLLNVLDGVASQEGRIVLMTSNHAEKLDPALVRPGRIDRTIYLGKISRESSRLMFLRMYTAAKPAPSSPDSPSPSPPAGGPSSNKQPTAVEPPALFANLDLASLAVKFSQQIPDDTFTPAQVQGFLLHHYETPERATTAIAEWVPKEIETMGEAKAAAEAEAKAAAEKRKKSKQMKILKMMEDMVESSDFGRNDSEVTAAMEALKKYAKKTKNGKDGNGDDGDDDDDDDDNDDNDDGEILDTPNLTDDDQLPKKKPKSKPKRRTKAPGKGKKEGEGEGGGEKGKREGEEGKKEGKKEGRKEEKERKERKEGKEGKEGGRERDGKEGGRERDGKKGNDGERDGKEGNDGEKDGKEGKVEETEGKPVGYDKTATKPTEPKEDASKKLTRKLTNGAKPNGCPNEDDSGEERRDDDLAVKPSPDAVVG